MSDTDTPIPTTTPPRAAVDAALITPPAEAGEATTGCSTTKPKERAEPTRYGDWELNGKCVDF